MTGIIHTRQGGGLRLIVISSRRPVAVRGLGEANPLQMEHLIVERVWDRMGPLKSHGEVTRPVGIPRDLTQQPVIRIGWHLSGPRRRL